MDSVRDVLVASPHDFFVIDDTDRDFVRIDFPTLIPVDESTDTRYTVVVGQGIHNLNVVIAEDRVRMGYVVYTHTAMKRIQLGVLYRKSTGKKIDLPSYP